MKPFVIRGNVWRVVRVFPGDPFLVDRTGTRTIATTDPSTRTIRISSEVMPPKLDQVLMHEITHAVMEEHGMNEVVKSITMQEMMAWFVEAHAMEIIAATNRSLGRPACVSDICGHAWQGV